MQKIEGVSGVHIMAIEWEEAVKPIVEGAVAAAAEAVRQWVERGVESAMGDVNRADLDHPRDGA